MLNEEAILERLRTQIKVDVYGVEVPEDTELSKSEGYIRPYITVSFGGGQVSERDKGIGGYSKDVRLGNCVVQCVAVTYKDVKRLSDLVELALTDWSTENTGTFKPTGILGNDNGNGANKPTKFFRYVGFNFPYNL